jgi:hypothetical protein
MTTGGATLRRAAAALCFIALATTCAAGSRTPRGLFDDRADEWPADDPMDGVLPPRLLEALEYVAYYFATACQPDGGAGKKMM